MSNRKWLSILLAIIVAGSTVVAPPARATDSTIDEMRDNLDAILRTSASVIRKFGEADLRNRILAARSDVRRMSDDELELLRDSADLLAEWRRSVDTLNGLLRVKGGRSSSYPGVSYSSPCTVEILNGGLLAALIVKQVADAVLQGLKFACLQTVPIPIIGGSANTAAACIVFSVVAGVANVAFELSVFCADERSGARLDAADEKLGHVHGDMESRDVILTARFNSIDAALTALQTNLTTRADTIDAEIASIDADLTSRANTIDSEIADVLAAANQQQQLTLASLRRLDIEKALAEQRQVDVATLILPASVGGDIDLVQQVTAETIARHQAAGLDTNGADRFYADGSTALAAGRYREAFRLFTLAYYEAIKGIR